MAILSQLLTCTVQPACSSHATNMLACMQQYCHTEHHAHLPFFSPSDPSLQGAQTGLGNYFVWGKGSSQHRARPHCVPQQRMTATLKQQGISQRSRLGLLLSWWTGISYTSLAMLWVQSSLLFVLARRSAGFPVIKSVLV